MLTSKYKAGAIIIIGIACSACSKNIDSKGDVHVNNWGQIGDGVRTQINTSKALYSIDEPIIILLRMRNEHSKTLVYDDQQVGVNDPFLIKKQNGEVVEYIKEGVMTIGRSKPIRPGEIKVLLKQYNIRDYYDLAEAGTYSIQFRGRKRGFPPDVDIPSSNVITILIAK